MRSSASGRELAALGRTGVTLPMLEASVTARRCEARRFAEPGSAGRRGPEAAQTRQIAHRAHEIVAATI